MRVLVCGGRDYTDRKQLQSFLDGYLPDEKVTIISGMARGADIMAYDYAISMGDEVLCFPADWETHGKAAGPIRNQQMLDEGKPDVVISFPGGRGTAHMKNIAKKAGVEVIDAG